MKSVVGHCWYSDTSKNWGGFETQCQPGRAQISASRFIASNSAFALSALDCNIGVCVREGAIEAAGDGVAEPARLKPWNMLPRTPDDPTLDSGGCSDCARLEGAACFVATGAFSCAASAALFCSCANFLAASSAARSSQYCGASESTGNIVLFRARVESEGVCRRLVVRCEGNRGLIIKIQQSRGRLRFLPRAVSADDNSCGVVGSVQRNQSPVDRRSKMRNWKVRSGAGQAQTLNLAALGNRWHVLRSAAMSMWWCRAVVDEAKGVCNGCAREIGNRQRSDRLQRAVVSGKIEA
jgi:hypothetical protein